ncbi:DUF6884 domain-containing protein [Micromonospora aurantiaca (nom. illeg.)]|uniref:DUF6884 domain-containing protein n=1 Tax=Micromonospora aurantiaca (nom. illeg.) TaxID=47850 RepID=UPI0033F85997
MSEAGRWVRRSPDRQRAGDVMAATGTTAAASGQETARLYPAQILPGQLWQEDAGTSDRAPMVRWFVVADVDGDHVRTVDVDRDSWQWRPALRTWGVNGLVHTDLPGPLGTTTAAALRSRPGRFTLLADPANVGVALPVPEVGPGRLPAGTRVRCLPGALPASEGMVRATIVAVGPKRTRIALHDGRQRRVDNHLVELDNCAGYAEAYGLDERDRPLPFGRRTASRSFAPGRWLPRWAWMGWTIRQHLDYAAGHLALDAPPPAAPKRLVIVGCGGKKADRATCDAHGMYVGSYHQAARRAADALVARDPGQWGTGSGTDCYQVILSAQYGLLDLFDVIRRYDLRMGDTGSVSAETVRYQAHQLGLLDADEVIVLAGRAYADVVSAVWPHARRPLDGTTGIGEQRRVLAAITATGHLPEPERPAVATTSSTTKPAVAKPGPRPPKGGRTIPLTEVTWETYGSVKAMGPDGGKTVQTGYVTQMPREYTGGVGENRKHQGQTLLSFVLVDPDRCHIGMKALPGTTFVVLDPPPDRPLTEAPSDARRMPVADVRADDLVELTIASDRWPPGRTGPWMHVAQDPVLVDGHVQLTGTALGVIETHRVPTGQWVSVHGPGVRHLAQAAADPELATPEPGVEIGEVF